MSQNQAPQGNKMGYMPIPKLLFTMSLPIILSMLIQALYNVVDSIFVAQINENALTAVSLAFPLQNLIISVASGTGVGVNALVSRSLGAKEFDQADRAANNSIVLSIFSALAFVFIGLFVARPFICSQTDIAEIQTYGVQYLSIISIFSIGVFMQINMERLLQSTGLTFYNFITQSTGAIVNIILDPILIFGKFGLPAMGVVGAAVATIIGQWIGMSLAIFFNLKVNKELHFSFKGMKLHGPTVATIYKVGVPSILMMSIGSIMTFGMNKILMMFSATAVAVFGVYFKMQSFFFMPVFGLNNGVVPIIAFNYGAKNKARIISAVKLSCSVAFSVLLLGTICFNLFPVQLLHMFNASEEMIVIGAHALRIISLSFVIAAFCIVIGSVFQALGNGFYSLIVSIARQLFVLLPSAYILAKLIGLSAVWWCFPISEVASLAVSLFLLRKIYNDQLKNL